MFNVWPNGAQRLSFRLTAPKAQELKSVMANAVMRTKSSGDPQSYRAGFNPLMLGTTVPRVGCRNVCGTNILDTSESASN